MKSVFIYGWCHHQDLEYLCEDGKAELTFYSGPTINAHKIGSTEWYEALGMATKVDLAIFTGYGVNFQENVAPIFRDEVALQIWDAIPRKVYWSFDTHWQWLIESQYSRFFDTFYSAHSTYSPLVPGAVYLPACFYLLSWKELAGLSYGAKKLIRFPAYSHFYGDREALKKLAELRLTELGEPFNFEPVFDRFEYCKALLDSKACLNIPSLGNLNFRNFEAWATNTPLLTPKLGAFNQFPDLKKRTYFFNRDFSDFDLAVDNANGCSSLTTAPLVTDKHMAWHRYVKIVNQAFGTSYKFIYPK